MPGFIGKKLCPNLVIVPPHFDKYTAVSHEVREVLYEYDPEMCPVGLDEAYLDITNHLLKRVSMPEDDRTFPIVHDIDLLGINEISPSGVSLENNNCPDHIVFGVTAQEAVKEMRHRIRLKTRLTASAGKWFFM